MYKSKVLTDQYGAKYSEDGKTLISLPGEIITYHVKEGTEKIGEGACRFCNLMFYIHLPSSIQSIGRGAFRGCSTLATISIPDGVKELAADTFCDCTSLLSVHLPESISHIAHNAFSNTPALIAIRAQSEHIGQLREIVPDDLHFALKESSPDIVVPNYLKEMNIRIETEKQVEEKDAKMDEFGNCY